MTPKVRYGLGLSSSVQGILAFPGFLLFFSMLFVPTAYQPVKAILLALTVTIIIIGILLRGKVELHPTLLAWTAFYVFIGVFYIFVGVLNNAPGALRVSTVYVLWPIVYIILVAGIREQWIINYLYKILVFAAIAIGLYSLMYILYARGILPATFYIPFDQGQAIGFYGGFMEYRLYSISSLVFLVPFLIAALMSWPAQLNRTIRPFWLWIAFVLGLTLVLMSGRRALVLIVAVAPIITLGFMFFLPYKNMVRKQVYKFVLGACVTSLVAIVVLVLIAEFDVRSFMDMFLEGFAFKANQGSIADKGALIRAEQFWALIEGWKQAPLIGAGLGSNVDVIRSKEQSWAYELSYVSLLHSTGLLGVLLYSSGIIWLYWTGLRIIRSGHVLGVKILPVLVGTTAFLMANATNPYLGKFDYIWVVFLPIIFINHWYRYRSDPHACNKCERPSSTE